LAEPSFAEKAKIVRSLAVQVFFAAQRVKDVLSALDRTFISFLLASQNRGSVLGIIPKITLALPSSGL
jgi:hypothetical protein